MAAVSLPKAQAWGREAPLQYVFRKLELQIMSAVLVVEDESHLAEGLRFNLEAEGFKVDTVSDGETAVSLLLKRECPYDVVVLDVMLPGKDGFAVASELRASGQFIP